MIDTNRESIEPALSLARECVVRAMAQPESVDALEAEAAAAVEACQVYLRLMSEPVYEHYEPAKLFESRAASFADERHLLEAEPTGECVGDPEPVFLCIRELVQNAELDEDSALVVEVFEDGEIPRVVLNLDGPGCLPSRLLVGGLIPLSFDSLAVRWTAATRGGRADRTPNGLTLSLQGMREVRDKGQDDAVLGEAVRKAEQALRLVTAAQDAGQDVDGALSRAREALDAALAVIDGADAQLEPADLASVVNEVVGEGRPELEALAIAVDLLCDSAIPPLRMMRKGVARFFAGALGHGMSVLPRGGGLSILVDYEAGGRSAEITIAISGTQCGQSETMYTASMRRVIEDMHGGTLVLEPEASGMTLTAWLPDSVGATLDEWIPGWERFSERSCQMLRLLKSGGQVPPEEFLLGGILDEELGRWLLPRLTQAQTVNMAHDMEPAPCPFPNSSPERLAKALGQIRRGKARKELAKPPYAAEILWAFGREDRHRSAIGAEELDEEAIRALSECLLATSPDYVGALRLIGRALG